MSQSTTAVPRTGLPVGVEAGPLGTRFVAQLIDLVPPLVIGIAALTVAGRLSSVSTATAVLIVAGLLMLAWYVVVWAMFATRAAGPGMRAMKLQLVGLRNGRPIGWGPFLVRSLILAALTGTVIGLLLLLVFLVRQPRKQGWHDLVVESVVIKQRPLAPVRQVTSAARTPVQMTADPSAIAPVPSSGAPADATGSAPPARAGSSAVEVGSSAAQGGSSVALAESESPMLDSDSVQARPRRSAAGAEVRVAGAEPAVEAPALTPPGGDAPELTPARPSDGRPLDQGWVAVLDDEREVPITGLVLLGRNPSARPGEEDAELVKVGDETRTVSKTHLSLKVDANGLFAMDRGSTNGTTLTNVVGVSKPCPAGDVVSVNEGAIVSFGDHWLRVERHFDR